MTTWLMLVALSMCALWSVMRRGELVTSTSSFASLWVVGLCALAMRPVAQPEPTVAILVIVACCLLFTGEQMISQPAVRMAVDPGRVPVAVYWGVTALAAVGAGMKLSASLAFVGDLERMVTTYELRGAVTSSELVFSKSSTALASCMYLSAALSGFICQRCVRPRYATHIAIAILDSVAIAGRGSFILVCMLTLLGFGLARPPGIGKAAAKIVSAAVVACGLVVGLSLAIGRYEILANGWEYVVGPIFGVNEYLRLRPPPGVDGLTLINGLSAKLGGDIYDAGAFIWYQPFTSNVSSGFKELLSDFGTVGMLIFLPLGICAAWLHARFRRWGGWGPYALALCCYSFLGYFYYVALSSFLTAWWVILISAIASWAMSIVNRSVGPRGAG